MAVAPKAALTSAGTMRFPAPDEMSFEKAHFCILFDCLQSIKTKDVLKSIHYPILCVCVCTQHFSGGAKPKHWWSWHPMTIEVCSSPSKEVNIIKKIKAVYICCHLASQKSVISVPTLLP